MVKPRSKKKFNLGQLLITPGAMAALTKAKILPSDLLRRHVVGDWGDLGKEDQSANDRALEEGSRHLSAYEIAKDVRVWTITEADRSATTILLPSEY